MSFLDCDTFQLFRSEHIGLAARYLDGRTGTVYCISCRVIVRESLYHIQN